jgi:hypothetical protein
VASAFYKTGDLDEYLSGPGLIHLGRKAEVLVHANQHTKGVAAYSTDHASIPSHPLGTAHWQVLVRYVI